MDLEDYTNILAATGVIDWNQANRIIRAIKKKKEHHDAIIKKIDDDFWDDEMRYGSDD